MIELENLSKSFGHKQILKQINAIFNDNEISVILGKSGEGKTTLMRIIAEIETADTGKVIYSSDTKLGMVFQDNQLYSHLSVLNNLVLPQKKILKEPKNKAIKKAENVLESLGIIDLMNQYPDSLSGGEAQRVAIARALVMNKNVLLLDEPTSALDLENTNNLINLLVALKNEGKTIIIITHDQDFSVKVSDTIYLLKDSQLSIQ